MVAQYADGDTLDVEFLLAQIDLDGFEIGILGQQPGATAGTAQAFDGNLVLSRATTI